MAGKGGAAKGAAKQAGGASRGSRPNVIIIRREEVVEAGHHGGAWKVAYADFVTAMMAFFLLMWLINATTEDQRRGIAAYFSPMAKVENGFSATGMVPGGATPVSDGAQLIDQGPAQLATLAAHADTSKTDNDGQPDTGTADTSQPGQTGAAVPATTIAVNRVPAAPAAPSAPPGPPAPAAPLAPVVPLAHAGPAMVDGSPGDADASASAAHAVKEEKTLRETAQRLRTAVARDPALAAVAGQMAIDVTPEGLRIQIMDAEHKPMFDNGATVPTERAQALLQVAARFIIGLPESVSVGGHTDAAPYRTGQLSNWSLSSRRADAARDVLVAAGLPDARLSDVTGYADRKLLLPADPLSPANRRIVLTLQRIWPQTPPSHQPQAVAR